MLETKEQKQLFAGSMILVILLATVSIWHKPFFALQNQSVKFGMTTAQAQAYLDYLNSIKTDPAASKQLMQTILSEDDIRTEVMGALQADQPVKVPVIDDKKIKVAGSSNSQGVENYLSQSIGEVDAFNTQTLDIHQNLFGAAPDSKEQLKGQLNKLTADLYNIQVPPDALTMHKALLTILTSYGDLVDAAEDYNDDDYARNDAIWPTLYNSYAVASSTSQVYAGELKRLAGKYKISEVRLSSAAATSQKFAWYNPFFVPTANAQFFGATTIIGNLAEIAFRAADAGFTAAFLKFMANMLSGLITQIEKNYAIANFLYYNDVLYEVYAEDYLNKYDTPSTGLTPIDQQIIKTFIPQFNCGQQAPDLSYYLAARAQTYLGFDPAGLDLNDPEYYQKMSQAGNFLSSPSGWKLYYQDLANVAQSAAQQSVNQELFSTGLKSPRTGANSSIGKSINAIISAEQAAFIGLFNLGAPNAKDPFSATIAQITQNLANQFLFSGVSTGTVYKEQPLCLSTLMVTPVSGALNGQYDNSTAVPTTEDAQGIQCSYQSTLSSDCTTAVATYINKCANNPAATDPNSCHSVAYSAYVSSLINVCNSSHPAYCASLQANLSKIH